MTTISERDKGIADMEDEEKFRLRVREFLSAHASRVDSAGLTAENAVRFVRQSDEDRVARAKEWQGALFEARLAGLTWPVEYGGQGLPARYQSIFNEEASEYEQPATNIFAVGFGMCIPTVLAHGTEELKKRYVPPAAKGEELWCQFFSEPGAGSDLAGLQTRAVQDGDEWIVNGQKVWTSGAHHSDYALLLARTNVDVPKHVGLTMFVVDVRANGITIRPLRQINGDANFNEVFFDDVHIPNSHVLADVNKGWQVAITTLMNERTSIGAGQSAAEKPLLENIAKQVAIARDRGIVNEGWVRQELADLFINSKVLDLVGLSIRELSAAGRAPGPEGSIAKLLNGRVSMQAAHLSMKLAGSSAIAWPVDHPEDSGLSYAMLSWPAQTIGGGTTEVMLNIIGERMLGLPGEPRVDRDLPFKDLKVGTQSRSV
jgi:alkylation response protein AidB-like acyl-CoA dehydrogenase